MAAMTDPSVPASNRPSGVAVIAPRAAFGAAVAVGVGVDVGVALTVAVAVGLDVGGELVVALGVVGVHPASAMTSSRGRSRFTPPA